MKWSCKLISHVVQTSQVKNAVETEVKKIKQLILNVLCLMYSKSEYSRQNVCQPSQPISFTFNFSHTRISNDLDILLRRPWVSMPQTKKPVQRRLVTLVPQWNPMQCRPDSCTWWCAIARKPQHLDAAVVLLSAAWTCSAGTATCHSQWIDIVWLYASCSQKISK